MSADIDLHCGDHAKLGDTRTGCRVDLNASSVWRCLDCSTAYCETCLRAHFRSGEDRFLMEKIRRERALGEVLGELSRKYGEQLVVAALGVSEIVTALGVCVESEESHE